MTGFQPGLDDTSRAPGGFAVRVVGQPAPQGSKRAILHRTTGRPIVVESSAKVKPWREDVKQAALAARQPADREMHHTFERPLNIELVFILTRPAGHFGTGRNAGVVKASAPAHPAKRPDLDKLIRSTLDALKDAAVYRDDALIVNLAAAKRWCKADEPAGVRVWITERPDGT